MKKCMLFIVMLLAAWQGAAAQVDLVWSIDLWPSQVKEVKFFPSGDKILNIAGSWVQVRLTENGQQISPNIEPMPGKEIRSIDVSPDGKYIASSSGDYTIIYDATSYKIIRKIDSGVSHLRFTHDSKYLLGAADRQKGSIDFYCSVFLWDIETGKLLNEVKTPTSGSWLYLFEVSPTGNYFAVAQVTAPGKIWIYDMNTYEKVKEYSYNNPGSAVNETIKFSSDGTYIMCSNIIGEFHSWRLEDNFYKSYINQKIIYTSFNFMNNNNNFYGSVIYGSQLKPDSIRLEFFSFPDFKLNSFLKTTFSFSENDNYNDFLVAQSATKMYLINLEPTSKNYESVENINLIYPNPAENIINISFQVKIPDYYLIKITDLSGKEKKLIVKKFFDVGWYNYLLQLNDLMPGSYFINLESNKQSFTQKFVINK